MEDIQSLDFEYRIYYNCLEMFLSNLHAIHDLISHDRFTV